CIEIATNAILPGRFEGMGADQNVVVENLRVMAGDEAHSPHVRSQCVNLFDSLRGLEALLSVPEVGKLEVVRDGRPVLRGLQIDSPPQAPLFLQKGEKVVPYEPTGPRNEHPNSRTRQSGHKQLFLWLEDL